MSEIAAQKGHPKGLYILFATEMWERFNYYGMRAVLVLFMTKALLFDKAFASQLYGSYTSLVYLTPLIGGFVADRYWGNQRSIIAGGLLMALGEFLLFFCGQTYVSSPDVSTMLFFSGLGLMIAGNGFFKPNISSLVGQLYPAGDRRIDPAYTIFYMGINVGGALGPFICGLVGDTGNPADFKWAFLVAGIGMLISVVVQMAFAKQYVRDPDNKILGQAPENVPVVWLKPIMMILGLAGFAALAIALLYIDAKVLPYLTYLLIAATLFIAFIIFSDKSLSSIEKNRIGVIFIVAFFVIFFWSAFEQAGASLTFFADEQTNRHLGLDLPSWIVYPIGAAFLFFIFKLFNTAKKSLGDVAESPLRNTVYGLLIAFAAAIAYGIISVASSGAERLTMDELPASTFQSLNSIFVVSFAPVFAWLWLKLGKYEPAAPTKMALGLFLLSLGYLWIAFGVKDVAPAIKVSMIWLIGMYALHTWGELCLSPIGLSLVNKLAPLKLASLLMAVWFLANAGANKLAGVLSALYPEVQLKEASYVVAKTNVRNDTASFSWDGVTVNRNAVTPGTTFNFNAIKKNAKSEKADSIASLSFIAGGSYISSDDSFKVKRTYPIALSEKELKSLALTGEKEPRFLAVLSSDGKQLGILKEGKETDAFEVWNLYPAKKSIVGFKLNNLYDFFMLFVVMSGVASLILFFLSGKLLKMMHGLK